MCLSRTAYCLESEREIPEASKAIHTLESENPWIKIVNPEKSPFEAFEVIADASFFSFSPLLGLDLSAFIVSGSVA
jgi:hypothetical protein